MSLRGKLIVAQAPLALALALVGWVSSSVTAALAERSGLILAHNYRSVLAAERMKEALERLDSHALFVLAGRREEITPAIARYRSAFESELGIQESNVTEAGEAEATRRLRASWAAYGATLERYAGSLAAPNDLSRLYFESLAPAFSAVKRAADEILALNQTAMTAKSAEAERSAARFRGLLGAAVLGALLLGVGGSWWLTARLLRPLREVETAVRRFGGGDVGARVRLDGSDEIARLAGEFDTMADHLERFRRSSLGELLAAQQTAQAAIDAIPDPVVVESAEGRLEGQNEAARQLLLVDENGAGDPFARVQAPVRELLDRLRAHVVRGHGAYVPKGFEEAARVETPAGERFFLPRAMPIGGAGGAVEGVVVALQDVTRLIRFDELRNNLVATVAHEFRTPLTSLNMALHLTTEGAVGTLNEQQSALLVAARDDCQRLQVIVDELLDTARLESGRIDLARRRIAVGALMGAAVDAQRSGAEVRHVRLRADLEAAVEGQAAYADPDRLQLVFSNLLSNAIRYSPADGEVTVRARAANGADGKPPANGAGRAWIRFEVVDRGPGISPEHQSGLFEKFFRVPGSPPGGSGLGLFIARGIVDAHGGRIGVVSDRGGGAMFWFTVPAASSTQS